MSPICLDDVWMPPVHTQHKESMLCQTKGVSTCPHYIWMPHVWMPPVCLDLPCMFQCPHMFGWLPVCFDAPYIWTCLYVWMPPYVWTPPYVWMPPVCLDTPILHSPIGLDSPCMFGCIPMFGHLLYVWMPSICMGAPSMFRCCQIYGGIQRYEGHPNIWGVSKHTGASKYMACIWTLPQSDKACFLCVIYVQ